MFAPLRENSLLVSLSLLYTVDHASSHSSFYPLWHLARDRALP